ncbi:MAG: hypothetical protein ACOYXT_16400 [Bacteroidota bacterium]
MKIDSFIKKEKARFKKLCSKKRQTGFGSTSKFVEWATNALISQKFGCYYCNTSIFDIKLLINKSKLKRRKIGHGFRGPVLEVDKMRNSLGYSAKNCVLSCHYCNNDKSYTTDSTDYKTHFGKNRRKYLKTLLKMLPIRIVRDHCDHLTTVGHWLWRHRQQSDITNNLH